MGKGSDLPGDISPEGGLTFFLSFWASDFVNLSHLLSGDNKWYLFHGVALED